MKCSKTNLALLSLFLVVYLGVWMQHAAATSVLIVSATSFTPMAPDTRAKLLATGRLSGPVDLFDAAVATPSLATLRQYDSVMFWSLGTTGFIDKNALGDVLADYVDGGGGIVATYNGSIGGRWLSGQYDPILRSGVSVTKRTLGTIYLPDHPIMRDVKTLTAEFSYPGNYLHPEATLVADWIPGATSPSPTTYHLAATLEKFNGRVVALGMPSWSRDGNQYTGWEGDGGIIMANALNWVAAPEPSSVVLCGAGIVTAALLGLRRRRAKKLLNSPRRGSMA